MGSFANSLHVQSASSQSVAEAIAAILREEGWQPSERMPARTSVGLDSPLRALEVSAPLGGWVSVLDSDFPGSHGLTAQLAERLRTHAMFVLVNDSDSWSYLLAAPDGTVSEFDSGEGEDEDFGEDGGNLVEATVAIQKIQTLMQDGSIQQRMQQIQQQMSADASPEVRAAQERMQSGRATAADMQQYQAWAMQQMPKHMDDLKSLLRGVLGVSPPGAKPTARPQPKARQQSRAERAVQRERMAALRGILVAGKTDEEVEEVFQRRALFAEETLAEFLPLVGISADYAHASFAYSHEAGARPLAAGGIPFAHQFRFERL